MVAFGTDGEKSLSDAFHKQFREARHLLCFIHVRDRINTTLRDLGICSKDAKTFIVDIFGEQVGKHKFCELVDSELPEAFDVSFKACTEPQFHVWFTQYQAMNMKKNMIKHLRQAAGLGNIPIEFTNNPNKSANARIKSKVDYKKSELNVFCAEMRELVDSQARDIERAFTLDTGPYEVSPPYHRYKENPRMWVKESKSYHERVL